jgi:hypothetical protein
MLHGTTVKRKPLLVIQTSQLMLYRDIIAVCSEIHTKHKNVEFPRMHPGETCYQSLCMFSASVAICNVPISQDAIWWHYTVLHAVSLGYTL